MIGLATGGLLAAVWQGMLLAAMVWLGLRMLPRTPARVRFAIWFGVFLVVAALPVLSLWPHAAGVAKTAGRGAWLTVDARWSLAIAAVWAVASLVRAGILAMAAFRVRALWKRATPVEFAGMDEAPGALPATRRARLCTSDQVDRPTVIGFFSPKILIPAWLIEKLTAAELQQIVMHETEHLGRADDWMNLLQKIALVVFPLNPALAWVERRLCFERELAVDERVLHAFAGRAGAAKAYAACLASLAEHRLGRRGLALALGALGRESELGRRVRRILRRGEPMRPLHARLVLGGAMLGLVAGVVALERCPQMVGFATAPNDSVAIAPQVAAARAGDGYGYRPVVFHVNRLENLRIRGIVNAPHETLLKASVGSPAVREIGSEGLPQRLKPHRVACVYGTAEAMPLSKTDVSERSDADQSMHLPGQRTMRLQWVVVTAWQGEDGSRLVLTTARTDAPLRQISDTPVTGDAPELQQQQVQQQSQPVRQQQPADQVHPYAAVPVRGGWLVFQL
jgi:beta-lactamase regulating signal transducer with metallopeptidase domain